MHADIGKRWPFQSGAIGILVSIVALAVIAEDERGAVGAGELPGGAANDFLDGGDVAGHRQPLHDLDEASRAGSESRQRAVGVHARLPSDMDSTVMLYEPEA